MEHGSVAGHRFSLLAMPSRTCVAGPSAWPTGGPETLVPACASDAGAQSRRFEACLRSLHPHTALQDLVKLESTVPSFRFRMKSSLVGNGKTRSADLPQETAPKAPGHGMGAVIGSRAGCHGA